MGIESSTFSDEESLHIFEAAAELVSGGEESINQAEWYRIQILGNVKNLIFQPSPTPLAIGIAQSLIHEAKVVGEAIRQARSVLQFKGLDDRSTLDRIARQQKLQ